MARAHLPVRVSAVSRQRRTRKTPHPECHRLRCSWAHWHRGSAHSGPSGRTFAARTVTLTHHVQRAKTHTPARVSALNRQRRTRKVSDPACYRLRCPWGGWHRSSVHSRPSGRSLFRPSRNPHLPSLRVNGRRHTYRLGLVWLVASFALVRLHTRHAIACGAHGHTGTAAAPIAGRQVERSQPGP